MADEPITPEELDEEELAAQEGEPLPDREAMSVVTPGFERPLPLDDPGGGIHDIDLYSE